MPDGAPNSQKPVGGTTEPCPQGKCTVLVQVQRADTKEPLGNIEVKLDGPTPGSGSTASGNGRKLFDPVKPGSYQAEAKLSGSMREAYEPPPKVQGSVATGSDLVLLLELMPLGTLKVKVFYLDGGNSNAKEELIANAQVRVTGGKTPLERPTATGTGIADFGAQKAARYFISVTLKEPDAAIYHRPVDRGATLARAENLLVPIPLRKIEPPAVAPSAEADGHPTLELEADHDPRPAFEPEAEIEESPEFATESETEEVGVA